MSSLILNNTGTTTEFGDPQSYIIYPNGETSLIIATTDGTVYGTNNLKGNVTHNYLHSWNVYIFDYENKYNKTTIPHNLSVDIDNELLDSSVGNITLSGTYNGTSPAVYGIKIRLWYWYYIGYYIWGIRREEVEAYIVIDHNTWRPVVSITPISPLTFYSGQTPGSVDICTTENVIGLKKVTNVTSKPTYITDVMYGSGVMYGIFNTLTNENIGTRSVELNINSNNINNSTENGWPLSSQLPHIESTTLHSIPIIVESGNFIYSNFNRVTTDATSTFTLEVLGNATVKQTYSENGNYFDTDYSTGTHNISINHTTYGNIVPLIIYTTTSSSNIKYECIFKVSTIETTSTSTIDTSRTLYNGNEYLYFSTMNTFFDNHKYVFIDKSALETMPEPIVIDKQLVSSSVISIPTSTMYGTIQMEHLNYILCNIFIYPYKIDNAGLYTSEEPTVVDANDITLNYEFNPTYTETSASESVVIPSDLSFRNRYHIDYNNIYTYGAPPTSESYAKFKNIVSTKPIKTVVLTVTGNQEIYNAKYYIIYNDTKYEITPINFVAMNKNNVIHNLDTPVNDASGYVYDINLDNYIFNAQVKVEYNQSGMIVINSIKVQIGV